MMITFANGTKVQAVVLARTDQSMRLALRGYRDCVEFTAGPDRTWISESGEIARIGGDHSRTAATETLDEFLCPQDLVAQLMSASTILEAAAGSM
jgi:hypothetical protein